MKLRAAAVAMAVVLAIPMYAQHGAGHAGFSGHASSGGHAGFAGHPGFTHSYGTPHAAPFAAQRRIARPSSPRFGMPARTGVRGPYRAPEFGAHRPPYRPGYDRYRHRDRDRDHRRNALFAGYFGYGYPGWPGYPYVINPGMYDWGDSSDSDYAPDNSAAQAYNDVAPYSGNDAEPAPEPSYPQPPPAAAPTNRSAYPGPVSAPEPSRAITVIFKNGRAPLTIQNYLMNTRTLTDLDRQSYEQIPLDQVDVAATEQANRAHGLEFQIPSASRE